MSWNDIKDIQSALASALLVYDWNRARRICQQLIRRVHEEAAPCPEDDAKSILAALRRKRRFELMAPVAEAFILSGQRAPRIRRQYAQALIDQGWLVAPEPILDALAGGSLDDDGEVEEAHGLLGRLYKQRYVSIDRPDSAYARLCFEKALAEYIQAYRFRPDRNTWHGVNVVALLHRAKADGLSIRNAPDPELLAREILQTLPTGSESPFELATRMEACIALGEVRAAEEAALRYSTHQDTDAFEAASTLRQMEEVWRLTDGAPPGSTILPILRATRLRGEGGAIQSSGPEVDAEAAKVEKARSRLERNFGSDRMMTLRWYEDGLKRTQSVGRVERLDGSAQGTGWLANATDFFPNRTGLLFVTNAHVVNPDGSSGALTPDQVHVTFQGLDAELAVEEEVVWSSPQDRLDATFLAVKELPPNAVGLPLATRKPRLTVPPPLVYIIGHPAGRDLALSLHDNKLLGCSDALLHYRTPTERGSSGSPVFEDLQWKVIGLHHAGGTFDRLDGEAPPYEANEAISIFALQHATRQ